MGKEDIWGVAVKAGDLVVVGCSNSPPGAKAEVCLKMSSSSAPYLDYSEHNDHTLAVGRSEGEEVDWPPPVLIIMQRPRK